MESGAPWLCSLGSGSLRSRAENGSGKQKEAGLYVSEQRALGGTSTRRKVQTGDGMQRGAVHFGRELERPVEVFGVHVCSVACCLVSMCSFFSRFSYCG